VVSSVTPLACIKALDNHERITCKARDSIKSRNPTTWLLVEKGASAFGQKWIFLNLGNNDTVPFIGNCGGVPDLANARIVCTGI
jgi:hypothetical protein